MESTLENGDAFKAILTVFAKTINKNLNVCEKGLLLKYCLFCTYSYTNKLFMENHPRQ